MNKKLTVGIPSKNRGIEISLLMYSLLNQTYQDYDIIIYNDYTSNFLFENSTFQGLLKLHKNLNHNIKIIEGKHLGPQYGGDDIFKNSETELIFRVDDDITLENDCIENLIRCFDEDKNIVAVGPIYLSPYEDISKQIFNIDEHPNYLEYGNIKLINDNNIYINGVLNTTIPINLKEKYISVQHLNSGFIYRKSSMEKIGGYFLDYSKSGHREETDVSYRLFLNGGKLLICPDAIAFHYHPFFEGIRTDNGIPNPISYWEHDEKLFIERFKNKFDSSGNFENTQNHEVVLQTVDEVNQNGRLYPKEVLDNSQNINKRSLINLITVTHGNHENLEKLIPSVFSYTKKPIHWIIINNDYSVESREKFNNLMENYQKDCEQDIKIHYKNLDKEVSVSEARNIGARLRHKDAKYLCFLDDDALILGQWSINDWLDIMYKELNSELDIGAVSAIHTWFEPLKSYVLSVACLLVPVKVWDQIGGFDLVFGNKEKGTWGYEDTDWSYRLQKAGYKIKGIEAENFPFYHEDTTFKEKSDWQKVGLLKAKELLLSKYQIDQNRTVYPFTQEQMECHGKKLNIGCYYMILDDFVNIDINPECNPDIIGDIRELNFDKESIDLILASQVIEHFDLIDNKYLFSKFYGWLKSGGHLIIEVPDVGYILDKIENNEWKLEDYKSAIYGNNEIIGMKHKSQFDEVLLTNMLKEAGFNNIIRNPETSDNDEITLRFDCRKD